MGMGGGGAGGAITAHVHDNNAGQGGALSSLSLLNTDLLIDLHKYELLDDYEASVAEGSHTFTPASALEFDTYSKIIVVIDGLTTASFALQLIINGNRASNTYLTVGKRFVFTPSETLISENSVQMTLCTATLLGLAAESFSAYCSLVATDTTTGTNRLFFESIGHGGADSEIKTGIDQVNAVTEITEIIIETSTSTWRIGTRMSVYGIKRT